MDFSEAAFVAECAFGVPTLVFVWLTWASGYLRTLTRTAYRNRWGLSMVSARRWPVRPAKEETNPLAEFD
jgi:hypothetical protein